MYLIHKEYQGCFGDLFIRFGTKNADIKVGSRSVLTYLPEFKANGSWDELEKEMEKMGIAKENDWLHIRQDFIPMSEDGPINCMIKKLEYDGRIITDIDEIKDILSGYYQAVVVVNKDKNKTKNKNKPVTFRAAVPKAEMLECFSDFFTLPLEETGMKLNMYSVFKSQFDRIKK